MKTLIFVGGSTASGKSTLADSLSESIPNSIRYRRYQGFFDIAASKNISESEIYKKITSKEVDDWFVDVCWKSDTVISDVHYAVQMNRISKIQSEDINIYQNYVPTISKDLVQKLLSKNIRVIAVYLYCSPKECMNRAVSRYNKTQKDIRNISVEDAYIESVAEEKEWVNLLQSNMIEGLKLNSELLSVEQLTCECLEHLKKYDEKSLKKIKKQ